MQATEKHAKSDYFVEKHGSLVLHLQGCGIKHKTVARVAQLAATSPVCQQVYTVATLPVN